jgi:hypothetical protein
MKKQCKTAEDYRRLQRETLFGIEAKPLPYLLCQMNLLLHGVETPNIDPLNALRFPLREIGDKDRVDVIMTNPPFGGEEERGILGNFPEDKQTAETALLFLQLIMRKIRRVPKPGRAAVVVPNGTLFGDGVCGRIKEELLKEFNLHTIVRLPNGVFSPYTGIPTNVLFFDRSGPTKEVWYYEHPLPEGRKNYTKTQPLQFEEFKPLIEWWKHREENERAWKVSAEELLANNCNLDRKNPRAKQDITHLPPEQIVASILEKEMKIAELITVERVKPLLEVRPTPRSWPTVRLSELLKRVLREETVDPTKEYRLLGIRLDGQGLFVRETVLGAQSSASKLYRVAAGDFIYSRLFAWRGAFGVATDEFDGCYVSGEFPTFVACADKLDVRFLKYWFRLPDVIARVTENCSGSTPLTRNRFKEHFFLALDIPLPPLEEQKRIIQRIEEINRAETLQQKALVEIEYLRLVILDRAFKGEL